MKNLAIITARSGSKGLANKNILDLGGKPLLAHTVEAALRSEIFEKVYVSTDSKSYALIAEQYGAIAYPLRTKDLAADEVGSIAVILDVLDIFPGYETFCLLQPTSPFRDETDIIMAYQLYQSKSADSVVSLVKSDKSPNIINKINDNGTIHNFLKIDQRTYFRQKEPYYLPNGALFITDTEKFIKNQDFYSENSFPYIMSKEKSLDIDDKYDYLLAKVIYEEKNRIS